MKIVISSTSQYLSGGYYRQTQFVAATCCDVLQALCTAARKHFGSYQECECPGRPGPKKSTTSFICRWLGDPAAVDSLWLCQQFAIENGDL